MTLTGSGGNANIDTGGNPVTLSVALSGPGGLTVLGGGSLTLTASNDYSGGTIVEAGTLIATNNYSLPYGSLAIGAGGSFIFDPSFSSAPANDSALAAPAVSPAPEPGTWALLTAAVCGAAVYRGIRSRRKKSLLVLARNTRNSRL